MPVKNFSARYCLRTIYSFLNSIVPQIQVIMKSFKFLFRDATWIYVSLSTSWIVLLVGSCQLFDCSHFCLSSNLYFILRWGAFDKASTSLLKVIQWLQWPMRECVIFSAWSKLLAQALNHFELLVILFLYFTIKPTAQDLAYLHCNILFTGISSCINNKDDNLIIYPVLSTEYMWLAHNRGSRNIC